MKVYIVAAVSGKWSIPVIEKPFKTYKGACKAREKYLSEGSNEEIKILQASGWVLAKEEETK